jgi:TldD protein
MFDPMESALKKHAGRCDYLEIRAETAQSTSVGLKKTEVETLRETFSRGGCVRAYYRGGVGFTSFNDLGKMDEMAGQAVHQARLVGTGKTRLAEVNPVRAEVKAEIIRDPRRISIEDKVRILRGYSELALDADGRIRETVMGYADAFRTIYFVNSEGSRIRQEKLDIGGSLNAVAFDGTQTQAGHVGFGSSNDFDCLLGHEEELREECGWAVKLLEAPHIQGGKYTVIADPHMAGVFVHEAFGHMSEGEKVSENPKMLEIMALGKPFGSEILNIFDTGLTAGSRGFLVYDDEGVPAQRTDLIVEGRLTGRLHTRETAAKVGEAATGSARAVNYTFPPIPRMRNTCIAPGEASFEEMISGLREGVYAVKARGGQAGEMFTFTAARAFMIRDGKVAELVRNATVSGNLFVTLKNIDKVGADFQQLEGGGGCGKGAAGGFQFPLPVADGSPHIRIRDVVIGGQ